MISIDRAFFQYKKWRLNLYHLSLDKSAAHSNLQGSNQICRSCGDMQDHRPHNYLLMTLDGSILRGLFEHERLKPASIRTNQSNIQHLAHLRQIINAGLKLN